MRFKKRHSVQILNFKFLKEEEKEEKEEEKNGEYLPQEGVHQARQVQGRKYREDPQDGECSQESPPALQEGTTDR